LPSHALGFRPLEAKRPGAALQRLAKAFRDLPIPVLGRTASGAFLLDLRCLEDEPGFVAQLIPQAFDLGAGEKV
jgi:L-seryl-tRNA(Ser) seleniumtransferase